MIEDKGEGKYEDNNDKNDEQQPFKSSNRFVNLLFVNRHLSGVTFIKTITIFTIFGILFIGLGIGFLVEMSKIVQIRKQYYQPGSNSCVFGSNCQIPLIIPQQMKGPIFFMYELGNFYQNHRKYIQSKNNYQLAGNIISTSEASQCYPYITNADIGVNTSYTGTPLVSTDVANPCGAIAYTFFTDQFQLYNGTTQITIVQTDISWPGDKGKKYKKPPNSQNIQWLNPQDQHFIVWMRTSGLPNFKKLWGKLPNGLIPGNYTVRIFNKYNSSKWNGKRYFIVTNIGSLGGKNFLIPVAFLMIGVISLVMAAFFFWKKLQIQKQKN